MVWLNGWVKELILIILLASFTDLLLPSHALQRYVRTVIGLFLLLVLLSPIYELFHHRWTPNQWLQAVIGEPTTKDVQMQSLSAIVQQSNDLKTANQKQAKQLLESQLAVAMKEGIESQNQVTVAALQVSTQLDDNGKPTIDQVNVVLGERNEQDKAGDSPKASEKPLIAVMKPVEPVIIDLKAKTIETHKQDQPIKEEPLNPLQDKVKQYIAKEWQLKQSQIRIS